VIEVVSKCDHCGKVNKMCCSSLSPVYINVNLYLSEWVECQHCFYHTCTLVITEKNNEKEMQVPLD